MHGYLMQNIPSEQKLYFVEKTRNFKIVFHVHHRSISLIPARQMEFKILSDELE